MRIIKLSRNTGDRTSWKYKGRGTMGIDIGDRVKFLNSILKWVTGKWLQGVLVSSFRSDIVHPGGGSNAYAGFDTISAVQKGGEGEWVPVRWGGRADKYIELLKSNLTGGNKMKIRKTSDKGNNMLRFDTNARLEIFVDQWEIESHDRYKLVIASAISDEEKIKQLKEIASEIARDKSSQLNIREESDFGIKITAGDLSPAVIDFERMPWDEMLHPEVEE